MHQVIINKPKIVPDKYAPPSPKYFVFYIKK